MEQHPVPQQISSYEFRLVGEMTLKQFFLLAGGLIIAFLFYSSGLPFYFRWPLVFTSGGLGAAMAFVPIGERPLQTWIFAFFKAAYSPTQFLWKKQVAIPDFLTKSTVSPKTIAPSSVIADKAKLTEYLTSLPTQKSPLDQKEEAFFRDVNHLFSQSTLPVGFQVTIRPLEEEKVPAGIKIRSLGQAQPLTRVSPAFRVEEIPQPQVAVAPIFRPNWLPPRPVGRPKKSFSQARQATFMPEIPMPSIPTVPNILVGMVKDNTGKIVEGAILEIRDNLDNPVRALKTNKLGQFRIATPLDNGDYEIITEKEGLVFDVLKINLKGEIVEPIEIKTK